jgi:hypothetical protein
LRELVDPLLQKQLIGAQIRQLVGAGGWNSRQQCSHGDQRTSCR